MRSRLGDCPVVRIIVDQLDAKPNLINFTNGTFDITTGEPRPHSPEDLLTKLMPHDLKLDAPAPQWDRFIAEVLPDESLRSYVQRAAGYSLTGDVSEQVVIFCYGTGANGKTTFIMTLVRLFADYARVIPTELLMATKGEQHPTGLTELRGTRLAVATEVDEGRRLNEALIKHLSGGERIMARRMRENFFEFDPTAKLWIIGNQKPDRIIDNASFGNCRECGEEITLQNVTDDDVRAKAKKVDANGGRCDDCEEGITAFDKRARFQILQWHEGVVVHSHVAPHALLVVPLKAQRYTEKFVGLADRAAQPTGASVRIVRLPLVPGIIISVQMLLGYLAAEQGS